MGFERQFLGVIEDAEEVEAGAEFDFIDGSGEIGEIPGEAGRVGTMAAYMVCMWDRENPLLV